MMKCRPLLRRFHALVEVADRGDLDLERRLRPLRRALGGIGAVARLARFGDGLQLGEAIADGRHDELLCGIVIVGAGGSAFHRFIS